jgi:hypothetical protein
VRAEEGVMATSSTDWFVKKWQSWIAETLRIFGFINREHIERKFGISAAQASLDLRDFQELNSSAVIYNKSTKRYEVTP